MFQCTICLKEFGKERALAGHLSSHSRFESYRFGRKKVTDIMEQVLPTSKDCNYCGKQFSNGWQLGGHKVRCSENPNREINILKLTKEYRQNSLNELFPAQEIRHVIT